MYILNGAWHGDARGRLTCFRDKGMSVVDYMLASNECLEDILWVQVWQEEERLSDHAPVWPWKGGSGIAYRFYQNAGIASIAVNKSPKYRRY